MLIKNSKAFQPGECPICTGEKSAPGQGDAWNHPPRGEYNGQFIDRNPNLPNQSQQQTHTHWLLFLAPFYQFKRWRYVVTRGVSEFIEIGKSCWFQCSDSWWFSAVAGIILAKDSSVFFRGMLDKRTSSMMIYYSTSIDLKAIHQHTVALVDCFFPNLCPYRVVPPITLKLSIFFCYNRLSTKNCPHTHTHTHTHFHTYPPWN